MRTLTVVILLLASLGMQKNVIADEADLHLAAHFGTSYAITMLGYGIAEKGSHMSPTASFVFAASLSLLVGFTYKYMEAIQNNGSCPSMGRAMTQNALGVAAAGLTVAAFHF